jgi:DNA modification methylase
MACLDQEITSRYAIYNGDSAEVLQKLPDESVHLSIYSPPFATENGGCLYNYSSSVRDLSNARSYKEFFEHYEFIVSHLARATMPGRLSAVHCMDVPKQGANICGYTDFPGDIIKLYEKLGFDMLPRIAIWKEPLSVRLRTMSKALAHRTICEDSTLTNVAASDYLIPFRKHGANPVPVAHPVGLTEYYGEREVPSDLMRYRGYEGKQTENRYSQWVWRHYASSMWDDIRLGEVLRYDEAKDEDDERHQHPLQLDVIYRAVTMWSNPGETVLTPFMGVGSEVYGAVKLGRRGIGCELKPSYYRQAVKNLRNIDDTPQDDQLDLLAMADDVHSDDFS